MSGPELSGAAHFTYPSHLPHLFPHDLSRNGRLSDRSRLVTLHGKGAAMKSARLGGALVLCLSFPSSDARALPGVRIKSLNAIGVDGEPTTAMDMARGTCETDGSVPEPFTDDKMSATVLNGSSRTLVVKRASIRVERRPGEPRERVCLPHVRREPGR
jgi:hypothetical protein